MFEGPDRLPAGAEFHHIGYATSSLDRERKVFESLGYTLEGDLFTDSIQGVAGCFLTGAGPRIELLEPLDGSQTLAPWINAGIKMYHLAYCVDDVVRATQWARDQRARVTVEPVPAVAFGGRHISFVMFRNGLLIEFIEKA